MCLIVSIAALFHYFRFIMIKKAVNCRIGLRRYSALYSDIFCIIEHVLSVYLSVLKAEHMVKGFLT